MPARVRRRVSASRPRYRRQIRGYGGRVPSPPRQHIAVDVEQLLCLGREIADPPPERDHLPTPREGGIRIGPLLLDRSSDSADGQPWSNTGRGEPVAGSRLPRDRRAPGVTAPPPGACALVTPSRRWHLDVLESDLVAGIQGGRPAKQEQHEQGTSHPALLPRRPAGGESPDVMVRGGPQRPWVGAKGPLRGVDHRPQRRCLERGGREREVERQVELGSLPVVARQLGKVAHPRLADQHARRLIRIGDRTPSPQDVVHLGPVHAVDDLRLVEGRRAGHGRRVVAEQPVLHDRIRNIDPEPRHAPIEPATKDAVEGSTDVLVPPVQVRLVRQEVVEVVLPGRLIERPSRSAEGTAPVVRGSSIVRGVGPHVPITMLCVPPGTGVDEPRVLIARVVRDEVQHHPDAAIGCRFDELLERVQPAVLSSPRRGSRTRRSPSRGSGSGRRD